VTAILDHTYHGRGWPLGEDGKAAGISQTISGAFQVTERTGLFAVLRSEGKSWLVIDLHMLEKAA
jgi:hypothetical protein